MAIRKKPARSKQATGFLAEMEEQLAHLAEEQLSGGQDEHAADLQETLPLTMQALLEQLKAQDEYTTRSTLHITMSQVSVQRLGILTKATGLKAGRIIDLWLMLGAPHFKTMLKRIEKRVDEAEELS